MSVESSTKFLSNFLRSLSDPRSDVLRSLQDSRQEEFDLNFLEDLKEKSAEETPLSIAGSLENGWGKKIFQGHRTREGFYHNGKLVGNVLETTPDALTVYYCKKGVKHGYTRTIKKEKDFFRLESFGIFIKGELSGFRWEGVEGGGYYIIEEGSLQAVFLYPDISTALVGTLYRNETDGTRALSSPVTTEVSGISWLKGVLIPRLTPYKSNPDEDPYECKLVEVKDSHIPGAGEGLFAKKKITSEGITLAYFNGLRTNDPSTSDYSIRLNDETILDIPDTWLNSNYKATLGHKVCHSFDPNAIYSYAIHPLFGRIRSVKSLRCIEKGEEITCNYKYSIKKSPPSWYLESLRTYINRVAPTEEQKKLLEDFLKQD